MLTGLDILLARMQTNPEEFLKDDGLMPFQGETFGGKWSDLLDYAWRICEQEERDAIDKARKELYRNDFNERVMKRLAGEEVKQQVVEPSSPYAFRNSVNAIHQMQNAATHQQMMQNAGLQGSGGFLGLGNLLGTTGR
jgi:hypothetical protein